MKIQKSSKYPEKPAREKLSKWVMNEQHSHQATASGRRAMKTEYKIIALSVFFGGFIWIIDSLIDCFAFFEKPFFSILFFDVSMTELYFRSVFMASFIIFGIIISRIVAEREKAKEALIRLASFPEQDPNPVIEIDTEGRVTYLNHAATEQFPDLSTGSLNHPILVGLESISTEFKEGRKQPFVRQLEIEDAIYEQKITYVSESDLVRIFAHDLTERVRMEEALLKAHGELEKRVQERTCELMITNKKLKKEIEERTQAEKTLRESQKKLRLLYSLVLTAQEDERKRIARDLHDGIVQGLVTLKLNTEIVKGYCQIPDARVKKIFERNISLTSDIIVDLRKIISGLRPEMLDHLGLIPTLEWYTQNFFEDFGIQVHCSVDGFQSRIDRDMETNLYRIIQEALNNVAKHAEAKNVWLNLSHRYPKVNVLIEDDGKGFDPLEIDKKENGLGLVGLRERVGLFKGNLFLDAEPGRGSRINIEINSPV